MSFNRLNHPILVVAPDFLLPAKDALSISVHNRCLEFSKHVPFIDVIGNDAAYRYEGEQLKPMEKYGSTSRDKYFAALIALIKKSHYQLEKFITPGYSKIVRKYLNNPAYRTIIFNYLWSSTILKQEEISNTSNRIYCIETHNDDVKWHDNIMKSSGNFLAKMISRFSKSWTIDYFKKINSKFVFFHVSEHDMEGYNQIVPNHKGFVVETGAVIENQCIKFQNLSVSPLRLVFVGSLGVKMNSDALINFSNNYYPDLLAEFGRNLEIIVVGNNPAKNVIKLCRLMDWKLFENVSDSILNQIYQSASFALLPFSYTTGQKLKMLDSFSRGIPVLGTTLMKPIDMQCPGCFFSDAAEDWVKYLKIQVNNFGIKVEDRYALFRLAENRSWEKKANEMLECLSGC